MDDDSNIDPARSHAEKPFDRRGGYSGQDYHRDDERAAAAAMPAGSVASHAPTAPDDPVLPPDNGKRASFDPATGAVHGSGASAGGGNAGEDPDTDSPAGDGPVITGAGVPRP